MNTHGLNSAAINGAVVSNTIMDLGPAETGFKFIVFERDASPMSGSTGFDFEVYGNLSRIVQIGEGDTGFEFDVDGILIDDARVMLEPVSTGFAFDAGAALAVRLTIGPVATGFAFSASGAMVRKKTMSGRISFAMTATATLTQYVKQYIPAVNTGFTFDAQGSLANYINIGPVQTGVTFDLQGLLATLIFISGNTGFSFDVSAALFNNPTAPDVDGYTLLRPHVDRTMVRRS